MGFPRDYLDFTIWYLRGKKLIIQADNATFSLTCEGIDFVEENLSKIPMFGKLLSEGRGPMPRGEARDNDRSSGNSGNAISDGQSLRVLNPKFPGARVSRHNFPVARHLALIRIPGPP